jgi:hypothetical protein
MDWCVMILEVIDLSPGFLERFVMAVALQRHFRLSPQGLNKAPSLRGPKPAGQQFSKHGAYAARFFAESVLGDTGSMLINGLAFLG